MNQSNIIKDIKTKVKTIKEYERMFGECMEMCKSQQSIISQQAEEIERVREVMDKNYESAKELVAIQASEIERLQDMVEIVLYHHPNVDDPIDYESAYNDLKQQIASEYDKNPWIEGSKPNE